MIRSLVVGAARALFNLSIMFLVIACLLMYGSYRLLRAAFAKNSGQPVREAGFATMLSIVALVKAIRDQVPDGPDS